MNYELLNKIIDYLEKNLTNKIDYKKLAKQLGINEFIMQRVFNIIVGMSLSEYVRKRRLSCAYYDLKLTNEKIIDIALKYGYESSISFTRSFKKEFLTTPSNLRKNNSNDFKIFPKLVFGSGFEKRKIINFEIKRVNEFVIYGKTASAKTFDDLHYKIRKLYKEIREDGTYELFNKHNRYALTYYQNDPLIYLVGSKYKNKDFESYKVKKGEYAIFEVGSKGQKDIIKTIEFINEIWYGSSKLEVKEDPYIECYTEDNCYIYVPLKKKQN